MKKKADKDEGHPECKAEKWHKAVIRNKINKIINVLIYNKYTIDIL